jgi:4-hydroxybenzoate polyprenyltransferase
VNYIQNAFGKTSLFLAFESTFISALLSSEVADNSISSHVKNCFFFFFFFFVDSLYIYIYNQLNDCMCYNFCVRFMC